MSKPVTITLSSGVEYTPEKGKEPQRPCPACPDNENGRRELGACGGGLGICEACLDYQHMLWAYRMSGF